MIIISDNHNDNVPLLPLLPLLMLMLMLVLMPMLMRILKLKHADGGANAFFSFDI